MAIENARLYETVVANEERLEKEMRFAQRVQAALLPAELPKRLSGVDVAGRFAPARELGGDFHDFLPPEPNSLVVAVGDVSGKGVPAALYGAFAGELVRSRTFRRRYTTVRTTPAGILLSMNIILHQRQLEEYYCTLCYASFDFKRRQVTLANSGLPYPIRSTPTECAQIDLPGLPLGSFAGIDLRRGDAAARNRRPLRPLLGRHLRGDERKRRRIHRRAPARGRPALPRPPPRAASSTPSSKRSPSSAVRRRPTTT